MKKILLILGSALLPVFAFAQSPNITGYVGTGVAQIFNIAQTYIIPGLTLAASAYFIWGVIGYIRAKDSKEKTEKRHALISGVIALAVIVSVWGIVWLLQTVFDVRATVSTNAVCPPGFKSQGAYCYAN